MNITGQDETFGKKLQDLRKKHHLTQEQLADKLQVSRQLVSSWEQDKVIPKKEILSKLSGLYGVQLEEAEVYYEKEREENTPLETVKSCVEKWEKSDQARKMSVQIALATAALSSTMIQGFGIIICAVTFWISRKWKANVWWLNLLIFAGLLFNLLFTYVWCGYMALGYSGGSLL